VEKTQVQAEPKTVLKPVEVLEYSPLRCYPMTAQRPLALFQGRTPEKKTTLKGAASKPRVCRRSGRPHESGWDAEPWA
jgi:hypothetical protein